MSHVIVRPDGGEVTEADREHVLETAQLVDGRYGPDLQCNCKIVAYGDDLIELWRAAVRGRLVPTATSIDLNPLIAVLCHRHEEAALEISAARRGRTLLG